MTRNLIITTFFIAGLALAGCTSPVPPTPTLAPTATAEPAATFTPEPTATQAPTATFTAEPTATFTPEPTATQTPEPTATATALPTLTPGPTMPPLAPGMTGTQLQPTWWAVRVAPFEANIRTEPSAKSATLAKLACGGAALEIDWSASGDASGLRWYHLVSGGWVREDIVSIFATVAEADAAAKAAQCSAAPTPTAGASVAPTAAPGAGADFTPKTAQVWNFTQSADNMSGTCAGGPILPPYGLVKMTPQGNNLVWLSQEGLPYTFARSAANTYGYTGPAVVGDATVTMVLKFTSPTTLTMSRAYVANSEPGCTHTHNYTGVFQWAAP